ncbi:MAG: hypothetical protein ACYS1A_00600 [Planctomycetota bacterium]|jgi:hypothetical protein
MKLCLFKVCLILLLLISVGCKTIMNCEKQNVIPTSVKAVHGQTRFDTEALRYLEADSYNIFITLLNNSHPDNQIGYRFFEAQPFLVYGAVPENSTVQTAAADTLEKQYIKQPGVFIRTIDIADRGWVPQKWTYYIIPVADGFEMLWVITTKDKGLNEYYTVQQCFRMSGRTNEKSRHKIALTPAFSEYDLWAEQEAKSIPLTSLSFVRRNNRWESLPAIRSRLACRTPLGVKIDTVRSGRDLTKAADPSRFETDIDCGLTTRNSRDNSWVCAFYWQHTSHISNHHPADCLHASVNLGPLAPHSKRTIRGKIYWTKASKNELFARWKKDFSR